MNRIYISLRDIPTTRLQLGFEGENDHTQVIFDGTLLYARYPSAVASMTVKSPSGGLYPKTLVQSGNKLLWNVAASDCAKFGSGQYQLTFTSGTEVIKTYIGSFSVNASLLGSGDPPDPVEDWLQEAQEALDAFEQDVSDAEAWAVGTRDGDPVGSTDPAFHNNSKYYAEQAGAIEQTIESTGAAQVAAIEAKGEEVLESIPSDYTALSEDVDELYAIKAPAIECSASGSIASFSDGADDYPIKSLTVAIEPVQDLHGYGSPWPAGAGKNLFDSSVFPLTASQTILYVHYEAPNGTYTMSTPDFPLVRGITNVYFLAGSVNSGASSNLNGVSQSTPITITVTDGYYTVAYRSTNDTNANNPKNFKWQIESGSTATAYAPYSNICPISGFSEVKVARCGINIWDEEWEVGGYSPSTGAKGVDTTRIRSANSIKCLPNTVYCNSSPHTAIFLFYDANDNYLTYLEVVSNATFSTPSECEYIRFYMASAYGTTYNHDISINYPATDTQYHPGHVQQIEYEFPSSAGTVYGGTLTIHQDGSGELVVDRANVDLGTLNWDLNSVPQGKLFRSMDIVNASFVYNETNLICSSYPVVTAQSRANKTLSIGLNGKRVDIVDNDYSDATTFKTAMSGVQFVYYLATPVTYQLTNQQVIETLKGNNVLWADTGDVAVSYPADTRLFIEKKISELQALILENISNS